LRRTSAGVDYAPAVSGLDLDGRSRTVDLGNVVNINGPLDLGAYEVQTCAVADTVFCSGFELP
jgi:hypothetical protein